ncbi:MAG: phosphate acyltransferase PlsX [Candidatus Brocadiales bacterium]
MRVAVDAMGGDKAPKEIVRGAIQAARRFKKDEIILVGNEPKLAKLIKTYPPQYLTKLDNISIRHASEVIGMEESGIAALRKKSDSSITKCVELVANGEAEAVVSAGNTGAAVATSSMRLRTLKGVRRPCLAATVPTRYGSCLIADIGANLKCKPIHLAQYAVMASVFSKYVLGVKEPRVGLLNIGSEHSKGNELAKETYNILSRLKLNFVGNSEGLDILEGKFDIVICDGFVGNVLIKFAEGLAETLMHVLKFEAMQEVRTKVGLKLLKPALKRMRNRMDYSEYGGVPLLGIEGVSIICHGRSDAKAIHNAIREALQFGKNDVNNHIISELETCGIYENESTVVE